MNYEEEIKRMKKEALEKFKATKINDIEPRFYKNAEEEDKDIKKFVAMNPYPSYDEMKERFILFQEHLSIDAEYGYPNHEWMKEIYENIWDKEKVKEMGIRIYKRGGEEAMLYNYYALKFTPFALSKNEMIKYCWTITKHYWDGVGNWKN